MSGATELALLRELAAGAQLGEGRVAVIEGAAGIGRTRILGEALAACRRFGFDCRAARRGERAPLGP